MIACCNYHASGGHHEDRHGLDPVWVVRGHACYDRIYTRDPFCLDASWPWLSHGSYPKCPPKQSVRRVSAVRIYVSNAEVLSTSRGVALLLGPYASHSLALSLVATGRRLAERANPYQTTDCAFGTMAIRDDDPRQGVLMNMLASEEAKPDAAPTARRIRRKVVES